jgi:hypothetical protein
MPYLSPPSRCATRSCSNEHQYADVYFLFGDRLDGRRIAAMKEAITTVVTNLTCGGGGTTCTRDADCAGDRVQRVGHLHRRPARERLHRGQWTGVGTYAAASTYRNVLSLQADPTGRARASRPARTAAARTSRSSRASRASRIRPRAAARSARPAASAARRSRGRRRILAIADETNQCTSCTVNTASSAGTRLRIGHRLRRRRRGRRRARGAPEGDRARREQPRRERRAALLQGGEAAVTTAVTDAIRDIARNRPVFVSVEAVDLPTTTATRCGRRSAVVNVSRRRLHERADRGPTATRAGRVPVARRTRCAGT